MARGAAWHGSIVLNLLSGEAEGSGPGGERTLAAQTANHGSKTHDVIP